MDWITRDFKVRGKLPNEVESFSFVEDHLLFRFKSKEEANIILRGGPWITVGQLPVVEP